MSLFKYILLSFALAIILMVRMGAYFMGQNNLQHGQKITIEARMTEDPQIKNGKQHFRVKTPDGQRIRITTGLLPVIQYGDIVRISGYVKSNTFNGHLFFTMDPEKLQIPNNDHNFISGAATGVRKFANKLYRKSLPPVSADLLSGIVFGGNQGLPKNFVEDLQISGVVHVIAKSGMNVTFVAGALIAVLGAFFRRQIAITIAIFGVLFYAFISGFEPSIVRASIMAIIAFSANLLGRQNFALASLLLTAFIMLLHSPFLITDVGFQLSFLATLGILVIKPILNSPFAKFGILSKLIGEDIGTTIAAQLATIPILMAVFGNYGLLSILINALVLWTVPLLMVIGSVGLLLGIIFEPLGQLFLLLSVPILFFFEKTVSYSGGLSWTINIPEISIAIWVGYYLILISVILVFKKSDKELGAFEAKKVLDNPVKSLK